MKTIIAGGRDIDNFELVKEAVTESEFKITEVVSGTQRGVDQLGERWAKDNDIPMRPFPPDWDLYNKAAGPIRNKEMARYADALILVWDGESRGSANMLQNAKAYGLQIYIKRI